MNKKTITAMLWLIASQPAFAEIQEAVEMINRGDFIGAVEELKPMVELGHPVALYHQAGLYETGRGVEKSDIKAFELYQRAANRGIAEAQFNLAQMYLEGRGTPVNKRQGFEYTRRAAQKGLAAAQYNLALMYHHGVNTSQNFVKAATWYEDAAKQNYALAQFNLAILYYEGKGVSKDIQQSYIWNRVAAFNGYGPAEQSMDMDSRELSRDQIKRAREQADQLYLKIAPKENEYKPFSWQQ
ncbi:tetratricopeptide repeat protein [Thalassotalea ponticola]|uniref:tetratricopeptide repeat protein n=1 Tax=Thalassotalea ponticola TaxID=1523392 RepID=UPI0025B3F731|nr:tetratricopeptide repeat protein [Thalassotalea ponticola]MDN3651784.1 tetratricopeptide repeat protein [Thalassotalea ponticola]